MDIPNICIRMLDISASIKLACEHRNHPTCQRVKDLDRTHPFFPSPMWDLPFLYVLHDDATTTDQMIPNTQTQLSNNPENMGSSCLLEHAGIYFGKRSDIKKFERKRTN